jgi:nitrate reductase (NAD(P)H)
VTEKAASFIKKNADARAKELAQSSRGNQDLALQKHRWVPVRLRARKEVSKDTRSYVFDLPDSKKALGLATCQHIELGFHMKDRMLIRSYTPTRPILETEEDGTFELIVKTYFPSNDQPGGAMSNFLDCMPLNEEVEVRGPSGEIKYSGNGKFIIEGKEMHFNRVTLILGGSGITPGYQLVARILETKGDDTQIAVIDANKSEGDILLKEELQSFKDKHGSQFRIEHILSHPSEKWGGKKGHVNADIIKEVGFEPQEGSVALLCGPPAMIQKAALPALRDWGYEEEKNCFGF